jgi:hypothetical protein
MKKIILLLIAITFFGLKAFCQNDVELIVIGTGKDAESSKNNALRNAIEQAFGVFISSTTKVSNDELINDEIVTLSNGNIKKYEIIEQFESPDKLWTTSLRCIVSISTLSNYFEKKGYKTEFNGNLFAFNAKEKELAKQNELKLLNNLIDLIKANSKNLYEYSVEIDNAPKRHEDSYYKIPYQVNINITSNYNKIYNILLKSLLSISIPKNQIEEYKKINFPVYEVVIHTQENQIEFGDFQVAEKDNDYSNWCKYYNLNPKNSKVLLLNKLKIYNKNGAVFPMKYERSPAYSGFFIFDQNFNLNKIEPNFMFFRNNICDKLIYIKNILNFAAYNFDVKVNDELFLPANRDVLFSSENHGDYIFLIYPIYMGKRKGINFYPDKTLPNYTYSPNGQDRLVIEISDKNLKTLAYDYNFIDVFRNGRENDKLLISKNYLLDNGFNLILNNIKPGSSVGFTYGILSFNLDQLNTFKNISVAPSEKEINIFLDKSWEVKNK